jgi:hypothetical protein
MSRDKKKNHFIDVLVISTYLAMIDYGSGCSPFVLRSRIPQVIDAQLKEK